MVVVPFLFLRESGKHLIFYILETISANNFPSKIGKKDASSFLGVLRERMAKTAPPYLPCRSDLKTMVCEVH